MINAAFIFPGQGAQSVGMGKEFYDTSPEARAVFDRAETVIPGLKEVIFNGPAEKLTSTAFCQPAIFTFSMAALRAFQIHPVYNQIKPLFTAGLSLGECTAVAAAGALSFEETLRLVERRSFFMEEATRIQKGAMAAVIGFDQDALIAICLETGAEVANFNAPDQIVISGDAEKVARACDIINSQGAKRVILLEVSGAFHSSLMRPAVGKFEEALNHYDFKQADFPVISNVDGRPAVSPEAIRANLARQITSSVQWVDSVRYMASQGTTRYYEIGPGNVLKGLVRKINKDLEVHNIRSPQDLDNLSS